MKYSVLASAGILYFVIGPSLPAYAAAATDLTCVGCVGTADLATGGVTGAKIANGSVDAVDLTPALLARITALEAKVAALKGGAYSNATLKGTYKCMELGVGSSWNTAKTTMTVEYGANTNHFTSTGRGNAIVTSQGNQFWQNVTHRGGTTNYLITNSGPDTWSDAPFSIPYTVNSYGFVTFNLGTTAESFTGWVSRNGDSAVFLFVGSEGTSRTRALNSCVRTSP